MTGRLLPVLLLCVLPLAAIVAGCLVGDWRASRRARRLGTGTVIRLPLERRLDTTRRQADRDIRIYRKAHQ